MADALGASANSGGTISFTCGVPHIRQRGKQYRSAHTEIVLRARDAVNSHLLVCALCTQNYGHQQLEDAVMVQGARRVLIQTHQLVIDLQRLCLQLLATHISCRALLCIR